MALRAQVFKRTLLISAMGLLIAVSCDPDSDVPDPAEIAGHITACGGGAAIAAARVDVMSGNTETYGLLIKTTYADGEGYYHVKVGIKDDPMIEKGNTHIYIDVSAAGHDSKASSPFLIELEHNKHVDICL